ncbi:S-layer homology domain-containing protein [Clostridiaceae bacterium M8S5]|nr:S-layer homology domain-containing protein [Clostridiaceae bacterium M8S5]
MKMRRSKCLILLVVAVLAIQTTAFAETFTDVPDWAKTYVEKMNKAGIIKGYDGGIFKPNGEVTREQAMVMIGRMLKIDSQKKSELVKQYETFMKEIGVATWAREGVAVCLDSGIVTQDVLKSKFYTNKVPQLAQRDELCIYITRAMGLEDEAKSKALINLPFIDSELMPLKTQAYVQVMIEKGIVSKTGDAKGKFNPKSTVTRAVMAKMSSIAYDYINSNNVKPTAPNKDVKTVTINGRVTNMMMGSNEAYITIDGLDNDIYIGNDDTDIYIDNKISEISDIKAGLDVIAKVTKDKKIVEIKGTSTSKEYKGTIVSRLLTNPVSIKLEWKEGSRKYSEVFKVSENAKVVLDGNDAFIYQVDNGDIATLDVRNNVIVGIKAESKNRTVTGTIKNLEFSPKPVLTIETKNGVKLTYDVAHNVYIKRNKKSAEITDLKVGDDVELDIEYNVVEDIHATSVKTDTEGRIEEIVIGKKNKITIINNKNEKVQYQIANNVDIEIDNKDNKTIYDLRLGYFMEIEIESDEITEIDARSTSASTRYEGTITYVDNDANVIIISVYDVVKKETKSVRIDVTNRTRYIDESGNTTYLRYLHEKDKILVIGEANGGIFKAKTVIIER